MARKCFEEHGVNRISIRLSASLCCGSWAVVTPFGKSKKCECPILVLSHFLKRILTWVDSISYMANLFKNMHIIFHLCLPGHNIGFWKCLSTRGMKVKLSGGFANVSMGKAYEKSDSALIKTVRFCTGRK